MSFELKNLVLSKIVHKQYKISKRYRDWVKFAELRRTCEALCNKDYSNYKKNNYKIIPDKSIRFLMVRRKIILCHLHFPMVPNISSSDGERIANLFANHFS